MCAWIHAEGERSSFWLIYDYVLGMFGTEICNATEKSFIELELVICVSEPEAVISNIVCSYGCAVDGGVWEMCSLIQLILVP